MPSAADTGSPGACQDSTASGAVAPYTAGRRRSESIRRMRASTWTRSSCMAITQRRGDSREEHHRDPKPPDLARQYVIYVLRYALDRHSKESNMGVDDRSPGEPPQGMTLFAWVKS